MLQVFAFGKLRMQCGDKRVDTFPTRHVEELLGYLLLHPQTPQPREKLIELLWPDSPSDNDRGRFSTVLWRLRSMFDLLGRPADQFLSVTRDWVSFMPREPYHLDINSFSGLLEEARTTRDGPRLEQCLVDAVAIYQGDLYDGIYADWCLVERERLARIYLRTLGQLMATMIQRQAYLEAVVLGREILERDPLREEVYRALMHCYWKMGRRGEAVRLFHTCSQRLRDELNILPMAETISLYNRIISDRLGSASASQSATVLAPADPASGMTPLQVAFADFQRAADRLNRLLDDRDR